jgi:tetratricopeptide (TPR) repeat protein
MQLLMGPETAYAAGKRYQKRGKYRDALEAFVQAQTQWQTTRGVDDAWTVTALVQGAYCKLKLGDLSGGAEDLNAALKLRAANPDAKDMPREVDIKNQLAWVGQRLPG